MPKAKQTVKAATAAPPKEFGAGNLVLEVEDLSSLLAAQSDPKAIVRTLVTRLVERYGVALAGVWVTDNAKSTLQLTAHTGALNHLSVWKKPRSTTRCLARQFASAARKC